LSESPTIPLIILTGFLGAGKTTILNRVLGAQQRQRVAVLVNELGRIDIDAGLIRSRAGDVLELSGGCVCHQIGVQRELWSALDDIVSRSRPDVVVLETTGIAEPDAIVRGVEEMAAADVAREGAAIRVSAVVTIVDAEAGLNQLARHDEARDQVRCADRILLTKLDRLNAASQAPLVELHRALHELNPRAERVAFPDGEGGTAPLVSWLLRPELRGRATAPRAAHRTPHAHSHQLAAASFVDDAPLLGDALLLVCAALGQRLVRAKGFVQLANQPRRAFLERAGEHTSLTLGEPWGTEPRQTRLVLIGEDLDESALQRQLWACRAPTASAGQPNGH
jgi:G3E family GTPase